MTTLSPDLSRRRTRTYWSILSAARAAGVSEAALADCVRAFAGENPDVDELCAALRDYVPIEADRAEALRRERQRVGRPRRAA